MDDVRKLINLNTDEHPVAVELALQHGVREFVDARTTARSQLLATIETSEAFAVPLE